MDLVIIRSFSEPSVWLPSVVCMVAILSYVYYENTYRYWEKRGVAGERPWPMVSELYNFFFKDRAELILERTRSYGKVYGTFSMFKPRLVVADAELIRQISIKDFDVFPNHPINEWANKYQRNFLVWLQGDHWKRVRTMMTPTFTSGKMKRMFKLMDVCADDLVDNFREQLDRFHRLKRLESEQNKRPLRGDELDCLLDLYEVYSMYTLDGITSCCYGIRLRREERKSADGGSSRRSNKSSASSRDSLLDDCRELTGHKWSRILQLFLVPKFLLRLVKFKMMPEASVEPLVNRIEKLMELRRGQRADKKYDDLLQMLVDARLDDKLVLTDTDLAENHHAGLSHEALLSQHQESMRSTLLNERASSDSSTIRQAIKAANQLDDLEILSEAAFLLVAGLDTTRTSLSTITYLLAHNPAAQERLYEELKSIALYEENQVGKHLKFDYDSLTSCHYLDAVISESLRMLAPALYTDRQVGQDYHLAKCNVHLKKGEQILLGFHSVHNDPDYWHEPRKFKPERFLPGPDGRDKIVPGSYAPFGLGPRHCIGMRFSLTETKLGLAKVVMNFKFEPAPNTKCPPAADIGLGICRVRDCRAIVRLRDTAD